MCVVAKIVNLPVREWYEGARVEGGGSERRGYQMRGRV